MSPSYPYAFAPCTHCLDSGPVDLRKLCTALGCDMDISDRYRGMHSLLYQQCLQLWGVGMDPSPAWSLP